MQTHIVSLVRRNSIFLKLLTATLFMIFMFAIISQSEAATQVSYQADGWDPTNTITRNLYTLPTSQPSVLPDYADGIDFQYILDNQFENSRALTSSAVGNPNGNPHIYQHIYGYSDPTSTAAYVTRNKAGYQNTLVVTSDEVFALLARDIKPGTNIRIADSVDLHGNLLLAKPSDDVQGFKNLLASFEILINKETTGANGETKISKVFKGTVKLIGKKNGKVAIKTSGNIKKKYITGITITDKLIQVDFLGQKPGDNGITSIPYKYKVKMGEDYTLVTHVTSLINTTGLGTGAEVNFGPDVLSVPGFQDNGVIPEPLPILLLLSGAARLFYRRRGMRFVQVTDNNYRKQLSGGIVK
jgi:hypothetical protein